MAGGTDRLWSVEDSKASGSGPKERGKMKLMNFYLYVTAVGKMGQPPLELQCGPYGSLEEAQTKFSGLAKEPGYEYSARIDLGPDST
jgi:hypothetical protein